MRQASGWGRVADPLPTDPPDTCDAVVVGLGATGLTCVHRLASAGWKVVGIDGRGIAAGAAGGNGGFLLAGIAAFYDVAVDRYGRDDARRMYQQTLDAMDVTFADAANAANRLGSLRIAFDDAELHACARHAEALRRDGFPVEDYDGPEGRGLLLPTDGSFDPVARASALAERAQRAGGMLVTGRPVLTVAGDRVTLAAGDIRARHVVVAIDGGLEWLAPELEADVRTVQLQMLATTALDQVVCERPVYRRDGLDYYQQSADGRLFVGGGRDVGGAQEWLSPHQEAASTPLVQSYLDSLAEEILGSAARVGHRWAAAVAMTESGLPVVRQSATGAWLLGGYNGTGNIIGPMLASALAARLLGERSDLLDVWTASVP